MILSALKRLDTSGDVLPFLTWEITFVTSCLLSHTCYPFWKGIYSKRKEFATGANSFLIDYTVFQKGVKTNLTELFPWKCIISPLTIQTRFHLGFQLMLINITGPSCSKLTMSLVNDSLKFTSSDTQIYWNFLLKKCQQLLQCKSYSHFFSKKRSEYYILNPLKQLTKWPLTSSLS